MTNREAIKELKLMRYNDANTGDMDRALEIAIEALSNNNNQTNSELKTTTESVSATDVIYRQQAIEAFEPDHRRDWYTPEIIETLEDLPSAQPQQWIPCSERLPKVGRVVLLSITDDTVVIGHREKPELIWQVTEEDGRKHWVYDPEDYEVDIDELPKGEDCGFVEEGAYANGILSVTSVNYDDRFGGVIAWMPLPEPYKNGSILKAEASTKEDRNEQA